MAGNRVIGADLPSTTALESFKSRQALLVHLAGISMTIGMVLGYGKVSPEVIDNDQQEPAPPSFTPLLNAK